MKFKTSIFVILTVMISLFNFNASALADQLGVVDINKILQDYSKSQSARADIKIKEAEIQKFIENAKKSVNAAKTKTEKKKLEAKYNTDLKQKVTAINAAQSRKLQEIQTNIFNAVKCVAAQKQISTVLTKESVILGGENLTDEVIKVLNEQPAK
ncbi:MAG: OmpH family outer membrane protein [Candidatus Gastranaerophilales bacterium]|nr:OmpH family outer membrane protein [Candidatus Gastranaerophilales bacterium]